MESWEIGRETSYFNGTLRKLREGLGLTGREVAEKLGIYPAQYYSYERMRHIPNEKTMSKIESFFGVKREQIFPVEFLQYMKKYTKTETDYGTIDNTRLNNPELVDTYLLDDNTSPEEIFLKNEKLLALNRAINTLSTCEHEVVCMYFGICGYEKHKMEEIAEVLHMSHEWITLIKNRAIKKMRINIAKELRKTPLVDATPPLSC